MYLNDYQKTSMISHSSCKRYCLRLRLPGWGNDLKMNTLQYNITTCDLASAMRQDENTIQNTLLQDSHRLTSKANISCL